MSDTGRKYRWLKPSRLLTLAAALCTVLTVHAAYLLIAGGESMEANPDTVLVLVLLSLGLLLTLATVIARKIIKLWGGMRGRSLGSRLQRRVVVVFCIVTIIPTILVSVSSTLFFNLGIQSWFNKRVSVALEESVAVAEAYLGEHKDFLRADAIAMASDVNRDIGFAFTNPALFGKTVNTQASLRSLTEALVIQRNHIIAQAGLTFALAFEQLPVSALERADRGEVVVTLDYPDKVRALIRLDAPETYLMVGRLVDGKVLAHMDNAQGGVAEYKRLKSSINRMQIEFSVVFVMLSLLLLLAAILGGLYFAAKILAPIANIINAADRVRAGDYSVRLEEGPKDDEIGTLTRAFNRMTADLGRQREELIEANRRADARRRFSEAVLAGVSAGVLALDHNKYITLANPVARALLELEDSGSKQPESRISNPEPLLATDLLPQIRDFILEAEKQQNHFVQGDISVQKGGKPRTLHIRITAETLGGEIEGYIVTFDDITELQTAQRNVAWADVARRVAHEIKNPLTPIQLSAERLRKKYLPQLAGEAESFSKYIDTITRHVADIGRMVEEFTSFARMPAPEFKVEDMTSILKKIIFSEQVAHQDIAYVSEVGDAPAMVRCDERQISQLLANLLKNAAEAIEAKPSPLGRGLGEGEITDNNFPHPSPLPKGEGVISIRCVARDNQCVITITDNGPGFPPDKIPKLLEPYFTTRAKGTGLGLAIVKKILDDHKASMTLENHAGGGAQVTLNFSLATDVILP